MRDRGSPGHPAALPGRLDISNRSRESEQRGESCSTEPCSMATASRTARLPSVALASSFEASVVEGSAELLAPQDHRLSGPWQIRSTTPRHRISAVRACCLPHRRFTEAELPFREALDRGGELLHLLAVCARAQPPG